MLDFLGNRIPQEEDACDSCDWWYKWPSHPSRHKVDGLFVISLLEALFCMNKRKEEEEEEEKEKKGLWIQWAKNSKRRRRKDGQTITAHL